MYRKNIIWFSIMISLFFLLAGCQKKEFTQEEKDEKFQEVYSKLLHDQVEVLRKLKPMIEEVDSGKTMVDEAKYLKSFEDFTLNLEKLSKEYKKIYSHDLPIKMFQEFYEEAEELYKNEAKK